MKEEETNYYASDPVRALAPTKVTLFGEHAVVYGYPALVASIPIYVEVGASQSEVYSLESGPVLLNSLSLSIEGDEVRLTGPSKSEVMKYFSYIIEALKLLGVRGVRIKIASPLPMGAGLGTSAAVSVGTIAAVTSLMNKHLSRDEIARLAWEVEKRVQGRASPMDTSASALGGILLIEKRGDRWEREHIPVRSLPLVIALFPKRKTTRELVGYVADLYRRYDFIKNIMRDIGSVTRSAVEALMSNDLSTLGELMNVNHGLLESIGVVTKDLANAVHSAKLAGALGAKASGAGGGGAVVAIGDELEEIAAALKASGAQRVFIVKEVASGVSVERQV